VRRLARAVPAVLVTVAAVLAGSTGTALAHSEHRSAPHHVQKVLVTLTGVVSDTATATIGTASDTATSTISIAVKGGERSMHHKRVVLTVDKSTVVRRGDRRATVASLRKGDHVSVRARRMPDGSWLALRINAAARHERH
jgi:hypothetical protein